MENSFFYNFIAKIIKKRTRKTQKVSSNLEPSFLFLNSNPWFSAVTDYSLQLALYLKINNRKILYGAEKNSTAMDKICQENNIPFFYIPIHNQNVINFLISFVKIVYLISSKSQNIKHVIAFEGREHTLLILTKILFPFMWERKKLIRVRAQAQEVRKNIFSIIVYKYYTDLNVFAAKCVQNRVHFTIPEKKLIVQNYCKELNILKNKLISYSFSKEMPSTDLGVITFLVLGRFDPVKGHELVLNSYINTQFSNKSNLIFIGKSENVNAEDLFKKYSENYSNKIKDKNRYYLGNSLKSIYIIDEKFADLAILMANVHFGIISSLASEVVCRVGVEFLQSGIPCIYSDAGALEEVFSDFPDMVFKKGDVIELSKRLAEAGKLFSDTEKYNQLKIKAKTIGHERYGIANYKNIFDMLFSSIFSKENL